MNTIGVIRNEDKKETGAIAERIRRYLEKRGVKCRVFPDDGETSGCDAFVVLGGDGTMLRAAKAIGDSDTPILGVNLGRLGYLTEVDAGSIEPALDRVLDGRFSVERRMMIRGQVFRDGRCECDDIALNDIVVSRKLPLRAFRINNYVNGEYLNSFTGDGEIFSTATGSTGYNLSVGGPIVSPVAELIVMTPHAPHSLISRSIVLSGDSRIRLEVASGSTGNEADALEVVYDGGGNISIGTGDFLEVSRSERYTTLIKLSNISFLDVLRKKMADE
ncbi:MAG: NAD(+)/NADH kinase [Lachnospiraceae bacterium]|nr:NAD(+)/NADH kinase [Lachnospiraceae bacterium]